MFRGTQRSGLTIVEVLLSVAIIALVAGVVATVYPVLFQGVDSASFLTKAVEAARGKLEDLQREGVSSILSNHLAYDRTNSENPRINVFTDAEKTFFFSGVAEKFSGVFYIERFHNATQLLSDIIKAEVVICFRAGRRIIGEDTNLNGVLDVGEDVNGDGKISSPIALQTVISSVQ